MLRSHAQYYKYRDEVLQSAVMGGKRILVIDDDKAIQTALHALLCADGHQTISALDAMQGVMMARQSSPDLIILDINMPAGGGISVFQRLRSLSGTMQVPVLIYTGVPLDEIRAKIPDASDVAFLQKPASLQAIKDAVARLLPGSDRR